MSDLPATPEEAARWLKRERTKRGWSTILVAEYARQIARREGSSIQLTQQSVSGLENKPPKKVPDWLRWVKMAFEEGAPSENQDTTARDELVYVRELDVRFAMGDGSELDDYPDVSLVPFNLGFLQRLTTTPTDRLFLAKGFGDSMEPLLLKDDLVLVDTNDRALGVGDTIWALRYADQGLIKRLRRVKRDGKTKVLIMSVNPSVSPEEADLEDVEIIGKVIWLARTV